MSFVAVSLVSTFLVATFQREIQKYKNTAVIYLNYAENAMSGNQKELRESLGSKNMLL